MILNLNKELDDYLVNRSYEIVPFSKIKRIIENHNMVVGDFIESKSNRRYYEILDYDHKLIISVNGKYVMAWVI